MTPKEKADQLIDNFYNTENCHKKHSPNNKYCDCSEMNMFQARQCALLFCDEIIKVINNNIHNDVSGLILKQHWNQVREEIKWWL